MQRSEPSPMLQAIDAAKQAAAAGEVPVGAVLIDEWSGEVIAVAANAVEALPDPTAHAEILVLRKGAKVLGQTRLEQCILYVTLEPCAMCAQAIAHARIKRLVFGAYDPKGGGVEHGARIFEQPTCHHRPEVVGGVEERTCSALLKDFFKNLRET